MALNHKISDVLNIRTDTDDKGHRVIEMELKFIRYRLIIDDFSKAEELSDTLVSILSEDKESKKQKQQLPKFYRSA
jgi:hypothetical protein